MAAWLIALSGLIFWALQFAGLYALASMADLSADPGAIGWRVAAVALSALCIAGAALTPFATRKAVAGPAEVNGFMVAMARGSTVLGIAAMVFQSIAALS
jgi:hypothetical protein